MANKKLEKIIKGFNEWTTNGYVLSGFMAPFSMYEVYNAIKYAKDGNMTNTICSALAAGLWGYVGYRSYKNEKEL